MKRTLNDNVKMKKLLCIGHVTFDTFLMVEDVNINCDVNHVICEVSFKFGAKVPVKNVYVGLGGGAANVAVGTTRLGINTSICTYLGKDNDGKNAKVDLESFKVDTSYLTIDHKPTDRSVIIAYEGERTIFTYSHRRNYILPDTAGSFEYIFLSSVGEGIANLYSDIIRLKKDHPRFKLIFTPGSRELRVASAKITKIIPYVDILIVNVEEGTTILNPSLKRTEIDIEDLMGLLLEKGPKTVVLTDGKNGAYVGGEEGINHIDAIPANLVEKTGAGDAFASAFVSAKIYGEDNVTAAKWGVINSASMIEKIGAHEGLLSLEELKKKL